MSRGQGTHRRAVLSRAARRRRRFDPALPVAPTPAGARTRPEPAPGIGPHLEAWAQRAESLIRARPPSGAGPREIREWATLREDVLRLLGPAPDDGRSAGYLAERVAAGAILSEIERAKDGIERAALCSMLRSRFDAIGSGAVADRVARAYMDTLEESRRATARNAPSAIHEAGALLLPGPALGRWVRYGLPRDW